MPEKSCDSILSPSWAGYYGVTSSKVSKSWTPPVSLSIKWRLTPTSPSREENHRGCIQGISHSACQQIRRECDFFSLHRLLRLQLLTILHIHSVLLEPLGVDASQSHPRQGGGRRGVGLGGRREPLSAVPPPNTQGTVHLATPRKRRVVSLLSDLPCTWLY